MRTTHPLAQVDPEHRRGNAGLWLGLAKARLQLGRGGEAAEAAQAVLNMEPGHREATALQIR